MSDQRQPSGRTAATTGLGDDQVSAVLGHVMLNEVGLVSGAVATVRDNLGELDHAAIDLCLDIASRHARVLIDTLQVMSTRGSHAALAQLLEQRGDDLRLDVSLFERGPGST